MGLGEHGRTSVKGSGAATAREGSYANSGVHIGDVHLGTPPAACSEYRRQVERISPGVLEGRDAELAELADFCTRDGEPCWAWWQAPAWAGKSALIAWFVLHPPGGVRVVSFFITARFAGHNNRAAFVDVVSEQLAEIAGEPAPVNAPESTREAHLLGLLDRAAAACREDARRLVLVVDGLDEDRGVTTGPEAHSIAALLPDNLPDGVRVVVSGRPNPPVPSDVPEGHPLRNHSIVRPLRASPAARVIKDHAVRELKHLLHGSQAEQDLLGLVTAAGGGLSKTDLAELTGLADIEVTEHLIAVSGRTFSPRTSRWALQGRPELYVLAHEDLQVMAIHRLGALRLKEYRQQLHAWAQTYRDKGWPAETPEYLLRGYFPMLREASDLPSLIECCLDSARHDRMLDLSGGDAAAFSEIAATQQLIGEQEDIDLVAAAKLSIARDRLAQRNEGMPIDLPAIWLEIGNDARSDALINSISDPFAQTRALTALINSLTRTGKLDRAERIIHNTRNSFVQARAFTALVHAFISVGRLDAAEAIACSVRFPSEREWALPSVVEFLAETGALDEAHELAESAIGSSARALAQAATAKAYIKIGSIAKAEAIACTADDLSARAQVLSAVAEGNAELGLTENAQANIRKAVTLADSEPDSARKAWALLGVVFARLAIGDFETAESTARSITDQYAKAQALLALTEKLVHIGCPMEAEAIAYSITLPFAQAYALRVVAFELARTGSLDKTRAISKPVSSPFAQGWATTGVVEAWIEAGDFARSEEATLSIEDSYDQARALGCLVNGLARAGNIDKAEEIVKSARESWVQTHALVALTSALAQLKKFDRARSVAFSITDPPGRAAALAALAKALLESGDSEQAGHHAYQAETAARADGFPGRQVSELASHVKALAIIGDLKNARILANRAEALSLSISEPYQREWALVDAVEALAAVGMWRDGKTLSGSISGSFEQSRALAALVKSLAKEGLFQQAECIGNDALDPLASARALSALVQVLAGTGEMAKACDIAFKAETVARSIPYASVRAGVLIDLMRALKVFGKSKQVQRLSNKAEKAARQVRDPFTQSSVLVSLVEALSGICSPSILERIARLSKSSPMHAQVLASIAAAYMDLGVPEKMKHLLCQAEDLAHSIRDPSRQAWAYFEIVKTLTKVGDFDKAIDMAVSTANGFTQDRTLGILVERLVESGKLHRAESIVASFSNPFARANGLALLAEASKPRRAREFLASAFAQTPNYTTLLAPLARIDPAAATAIAQSASAM